MKTLGVDLAAQPKKTARCLVSCSQSGATVEALALGQTDADLIAAVAEADAVGIDAPFGWPLPFVDAVSTWARGGPWPAASSQALRLRRTDLRVAAEVKAPLSVSTDKLGVAAFRCAGLLDRLGVQDRAGDGRVFEVYPAAALKQWGLPFQGYKGKEGRATLHSLCAELRRACPWLRDIPSQCAQDDDAFDALICALVARAAKLRKTSPADDPAARKEGWIHIPTCGLNALV